MSRAVIKKVHINVANILSLTGLALGFVAFMNVHKDLELSLKLIILATILDQLDGRIARYLKIESEVGKQIDSFVDMLNFGLFAPFILIMAYDQINIYSISMVFIFTVAALLRLTRFNLQDNQSVFYGIPVPCAAILVIMPVIFQYKLETDINLLTVVLTIIPISIGMLMKTKTISIKTFKLGVNYFSLFVFILTLITLYDILWGAVLFGSLYILTIIHSILAKFSVKKQ